MPVLRRLAVIAASVVAVSVLPAAAQATPGSGVSGAILAQGSMPDRVKIRTAGATDVIVRHITIQPGGTTGWHYHLGPVLAVVQAGTLTHFDADCTAVSYPTGRSLVEPSGKHHVHMARNLGTVPVELYVTYVDPAGSPLSVDAADPGCTPGS